MTDAAKAGGDSRADRGGESRRGPRRDRATDAAAPAAAEGAPAPAADAPRGDRPRRDDRPRREDRPQGENRGDRKPRPPRDGDESRGPRRPQGDRKPGGRDDRNKPQVFEARPPREDKRDDRRKVDPDNPFAALANLMKQK